jgi:hypothetical protein
VLSDEGYLLLHEVRLRGLLVIEAGSEHAVQATALTEAGFVVPVRTAIRITADGRAAHDQWARVAPATAVEAAVTRGYERFLPMNQEFLHICNDWQVRTGNVPNDHGDATYDWSVVDRLRNLDERTVPIVRRVARAVARFDMYPRRLRAALNRVDEGEREWFTSPRIDSYHTVWMQLHEDLLLALGKSREHEPQV